MRFGLTPKENHNPPHNIFWLVLGLVFIFTTFILVIVATAGSTANYTPLNNIYLGDANIAHINVSKVIPQMGPILTILGSALTAPDSSLDQIFGALNAVSTTPALTPLLLLLANAENTTNTISSLTELAPLALEGNPTESTKELIGMAGLIKVSDNGNQTLEGLGQLILPTMQNFNDSQLMQASDLTLELLSRSNDPLNSTRSLKVLNNLTLSEKASLLPVFSLYEDTNNVTQLNQALVGIMSASGDVSRDQALTLMSTLGSMLETDPDQDLSQTFNGLSQLVSPSQTPALNAIRGLLESSSDVNSTLTTLTEMIRDNITENDAAKLALPAMVNVINNSKNVTEDLGIIRSLALVRNTTATGAQLIGLESILDASNDQAETVKIIDDLQEGLTPNSSTINYIPSLFTLMNSSANPESTFSSLVTLTSWAQENPETFEPIVDILNDAADVEPISEETLAAMTPVLLEYLKIPIYFRMAIFTLCKGDINNDIISCNSPHAVQDLDFRNIIYDSLMESDFQPYLRGLNISAQDLHLEGDLLNRQHEYVPSISALLAMNLLTIITAAAIMGFIIFILLLGWKHMWAWYTIFVLCFFVSVFNGIGATINAIVIEVIKSGTYDDKYGVVYETGVPYSGLMWTGFVLCCFTTLIIMFCSWNARAYFKWRNSLQDEIEDADVEKTTATEAGVNTVPVVGVNDDIHIVKTKSTEDDSMVMDEKDDRPSNDHVEEAPVSSSTDNDLDVVPDSQPIVHDYGNINSNNNNINNNNAE